MSKDLASSIRPESRVSLDAAKGWAIVTDLDGTLLDDSYDLSAAAVAINALKASSFEIRLVALASSKTLSEMLLLAELCNNPPVLIFENGAGRAVPAPFLPKNFAGPMFEAAHNVKYGIEIKGTEYRQICQVLAQLRDELGFAFTGFSDMESAELAALTGLSMSGASLARDRKASEPIVWHGTQEELARFCEALALEDLQVVSGGRFLHVSSSHDKAASFFESLSLCAPGSRVLACGDAPNDLKLLRQAHHALVFPHSGQSYLLKLSATTSHAPVAGSDAWLQSVTAILESHKLNVEG